MSDIKIEKAELFKEALANGVNILAGAGFSVLPDLTGKSLPTGEQLCDELEKKFGGRVPGWGLEEYTQILERNYPDEFQKFLRERFTVGTYNPLYSVLDSIKINSWATTNIDNIIHLICKNSKRYSLSSSTYYGAIRRTSEILKYIPLHGDVTNIHSKLFFGKFDLTSVAQTNEDLFNILFSELIQYPTIFWGYGFHDSGVMRVVKKVFEKNNRQHIWIQCLPDRDESRLTFFKSMGCFIIEGSTDQLLKWIASQDLSAKVIAPANPVSDNVLSRYILPVPGEKNIVPISRDDFYKRGISGWYNVVYENAHKNFYLDDVLELSTQNKNMILVGIPLAGKTTLLMQVAIKKQASLKLFVSDITASEAEMIIKRLSGKDCVIFFDNCFTDVNAFTKLSLCKNIKIIGTDNEYSFESCKHLLRDVATLNISEINYEQARELYNSIPRSIRKPVFTFQKSTSDKTSIVEVINYNVKDSDPRPAIYLSLKKIRHRYKDVFDTISLATFLSMNNSLLSTDVMMHCFSKDYSSIRNIIDKTNSLLKELDVSIIPDTLDQDYFSLRSNLFLIACNDVLIKNFKEDYASILKVLLSEISPYVIYHFYNFKRTAYDAKTIYKIFGADAEYIYEHIFKYEHNEYSLQHWALYLLRTEKYEKAFHLIDEAISMAPNNFSIRNSHAIMLFEANKYIPTQASHDNLIKSMDILENCYNNDKRKIYHAQKFAEFSLYLYKRYRETGFLCKADKWLREVINGDNSPSRLTRNLYAQINTIVANL